MGGRAVAGGRLYEYQYLLAVSVWIAREVLAAPLEFPARLLVHSETDQGPVPQ